MFERVQMSDIEVHSIPATTQGRVLVRRALTPVSRGALVGLHGYMESASTQMERLEAISSASAWTLVAIQGLHRFYRGRSQDVVASWMTREDRDAAIADNLAYVTAALEAVLRDSSTSSTRIVLAGFSQGVATAFRTAARGRHRAIAVIAVGGDVPPELLADSPLALPRVLLARGARDDWYTAPRFDADVAALTARGVPLQAHVYDGAHEWNASASSAIEAFLASLAGTDGPEQGAIG
jgi:predicted esterase